MNSGYLRVFSTFFVLSFLLSVVGLNLSNSGVVLAQQSNRNPIRICHSTDSHSNPYNNQTVDQDSVDGDSGNDNGQGDHYLTHNQPFVWYPGIPDHSWGDIIPPIEGVHNGLNWSNGQGIWNNACNIPGESTPTPTPTGSASPTPTPTPTPDPGDICANIDGVQTTVPADYHLDASGRNCVQFELGGPPPSNGGTSGGQVLGTSTVARPRGRVLGASTLAKTGSGQDVFTLIFSIGAISASLGIRKYAYTPSTSKAKK